jgi:hypothetical protein
VAGRDGHHHPVAGRPKRLDAPLVEGAAGQNDERLGPVGSKAFAASAGGNNPDDAQAVAPTPLRVA